MAPPPLVDLDDFDRRVPGGIDEVDKGRAAWCLESASAWARAEAQRDWIVDGAVVIPPEHDIVRYIVSDIAYRVFENPDGLSQSVVDGATEMLTNPSSDTYLTAGERAKLRRLRPSSSHAGIGTITTTRLEHHHHGDRVPVTGYAEPEEAGVFPQGAKSIPWIEPGRPV